MTAAQEIIQLCLYEGGPLEKNTFPKLNSEIISEIKNLLSLLNLHLIETNSTLEISLSLEINEQIQKQKIQDLKTDLSESALQTLSVILYKPGSTKAEIDFVRGVDSVRSLKSLITRGLIEKNEEKRRRNYYPTTETLKFLGLQNVENIPEFSEISDKLSKLILGE